MEQITTITGQTFHLKGDDIDTDRIIPARYLKCVTFEGLGNHVFEDDRKQLSGKHPFDLPKNQGGSVLLVDNNFGSGSSREHAVPALMQWGIKAIIGLSFAEIFRGNAVGNGLPCVNVTALNHARIQNFLETHQDVRCEVDLNTMRIELSAVGGFGSSLPCEMPDANREKLITGTWDDIATCLEAGPAIEAVFDILPYAKSA